MKKLYQSPVLDIVLFEMENDVLATSSAEVETPWPTSRSTGIRSNKEDQ